MAAPFTRDEDNEVVWDERCNELTSRKQLEIRRELEVSTATLAVEVVKAAGMLALYAAYVPVFIWQQCNKKKP